MISSPAIPVQGVQAFLDPNTLGLGLAAFSGYTKVVEAIFSSDANGIPVLNVMVFYEDT